MKREEEYSDIASAAESLLGTKFVLYGREPDHGLDCVGLVCCCLKLAGTEPCIPEGYQLHNSDESGWLGCAERSGLLTATGQVQRGDIILQAPGPAQLHLVIATSVSECIHAHAGLRRVVRQRLTPDHQMVAHWRLDNINK